MRNFHALIEAVQRNCHITDARHARSMTMCIYLLEMQHYYRWENEIPYAASLPKSELGAWLAERERFWNDLEELPYSTLPVGEEIDPFDSESVNRLIVPEGYIYSAGYGRFKRPHFFLGKLLKKETRGKYTVLVSGCEYARDLVAPPAALLNGTIFLRREAVRHMVWEKHEEWKWMRRNDPSEFDPYGMKSESDLDAATERECEAVILHELGEGMAGELFGKGWEAMLSDASSVKTEIVIRAVRDLLADCLSTLPELMALGEERALHFYFGNLTGMRSELFPSLVSAYRKWCASGDRDFMDDAVKMGSEHWLRVGKNLLERYGREGGLLLEDWTEFRR